MSEYLQDKNAGNAGDYLKHFWLIKLVEKVMGVYPSSSIAYIESHAGAGLYNLEETHWKFRKKYRNLICEDDDQWTAFDRFNPLDNKQYFGSFMLTGKLLLEHKRQNFKIVLHEKDENVVLRIRDCASKLSPDIRGESNPNIIKSEIAELKKAGFDIIICLVDPYFKEGEKDKIWCEMLAYHEPGCFMLMFDTWNLLHNPHCSAEMLIQSIKYQIRGYGMYGNKQSRDILTDIK
jgi:23S rRNA A2030 N6-methylase RlmJ